jgi:hypothetical protein
MANDTTPVTASARKKGSEKMMNAFATAILSFPPFQGLFLENQSPITSKTIAKMRATIDNMGNVEQESSLVVKPPVEVAVNYKPIE